MQPVKKGVIIGPMNSRLNLETVLTLCICAVFASSAVAATPKVKVANAWARASAPGQTTAVVYMDLKSDTDAAVIGASSSRAARLELHSTTTDGGVMRMRQIERVQLPRGKTVKLAPNGVHLMLVDVKQPLKPGERVPVTLDIEARGERLKPMKVEAEVRALHGAHHHH